MPVSFPSGSIANFFVVARRIGAPATPRRWCQCGAGKTRRTLPETSMSGAWPIGRANTTGSLCLDREIISPPRITWLPDRISGRGCCGSCATNSISIMASRTQTGVWAGGEREVLNGIGSQVTQRSGQNVLGYSSGRRWLMCELNSHVRARRPAGRGHLHLCRSDGAPPHHLWQQPQALLDDLSSAAPAAATARPRADRPAARQSARSPACAGSRVSTYTAGTASM